MEDETIINECFQVPHSSLVHGPLALFAVCDGHGGRTAAIFMRDRLQPALELSLTTATTVEDALIAAYVAVDTEFLALQRAAVVESIDTSGTTCVAALMQLETGDLWLANVGDSRALISRDIVEAQALSVDQKACRMDEIKRIRAAGGFVINKRVMGELAISRAIGDIGFKDEDLKMVIAVPEIQHCSILDPPRTLATSLTPMVKEYAQPIPLPAGSECTGVNAPVRPLRDQEIGLLVSRRRFVLLACDGLFDVLSNDQVVFNINQYYMDCVDDPDDEAQVSDIMEGVPDTVPRPIVSCDPFPAGHIPELVFQKISRRLVTHAINVKYSTDNVTCIIIECLVPEKLLEARRLLLAQNSERVVQEHLAAAVAMTLSPPLEHMSISMVDHLEAQCVTMTSVSSVSQSNTANGTSSLVAEVCEVESCDLPVEACMVFEVAGADPFVKS